MPSGAVHRIRAPAAFDVDSARALFAALSRADLGRGAAVDGGSRERGVFVLEGAGDGVFCRGMSFAAIAAIMERANNADDAAAANAIDAGVRAYADCLALLRTMALPVVAVVEGECLAGGVGVAAACDIVVASRSSTFGLSEVLFGLIPAMVLPFLSERMPPQKARAMALSAGAISAERAHEIGLVDHLVDDDKVARTVRAVVRNLGRDSARGVESLKRFTAGAGGTNALAALELAVEETRNALRSPEVIRNIRRFVSDGALPYTEEP